MKQKFITENYVKKRVANPSTNFQKNIFLMLLIFLVGASFQAFSQNEQSGETVVIYSKNIQPNDSIYAALFDSINNSEKCIGFYTSDTTKPAFIYEKINGMASLITFWQNGNTKKSETYKNNALNGICFSAHENGLMASKGVYKNGNKNRIWKYWDVDGELVKEEKYENGKLISTFDKANFSSLKLSKLGTFYSVQSSYFNFNNLNNELEQYGFKTILPERLFVDVGFLYGNKKNFFVSLDVAGDFFANSQTPYYRTISGINYTFCLNKTFLNKQLWSLMAQAGIVNVHEKFNFYSATNVAYVNSLTNYIGNGTLSVKNNYLLKAGLEIDLDKKIIFPKANANTGTSAFIETGVYVPVSNSKWEEGNEIIKANNPVLFNGFYLGFGIRFF